MAAAGIQNFLWSASASGRRQFPSQAERRHDERKSKGKNAALLILLLMAATSHDFWLKNLTAPVWKRLHMLVYAAYALLLAHLLLG
jgi:hypothetical protein